MTAQTYANGQVALLDLKAEGSSQIIITLN